MFIGQRSPAENLNFLSILVVFDFNVQQILGVSEYSSRQQHLLQRFGAYPMTARNSLRSHAVDRNGSEDQASFIAFKRSKQFFCLFDVDLLLL